MRLIKNCLRQDVSDLCSRIVSLTDKYDKECTELFKNKKDTSISEDEKTALNSYKYLHALEMIGDYENMEISSVRGLTAYHKTLSEPTVELKPSGEESACIRLWSITPEYVEKFETKHQVIQQ
jgi:hypothetical protein